MIIGGVVAAVLAVNAERKSLEDIAEPMTKARPATGNAEAVTGA